MKTIAELVGSQYPIFGGAMAQLSNYQLVSAISNAGGVGIIASAGLSAAEVRQEIKQCQALTTAPFGVNLMLLQPNVSEIVNVIIEEGVTVVTTGAGTPKVFMPALKQAGVKVFPVVPSVKLALKMVELGVAGLIVEGTEAGGHIGASTTLALVPQVVDAVDLPVIAAGGIADGRGIVACEALGAVGVQIGTRFLASEECPAALAYKQMLLETDDQGTLVTGQLSGAPVRSIRNPMSEQYLALERRGASSETLEQLGSGALTKAVKEGDMINGSLMAGQITGLIKEILPVKTIIDQLVSQRSQVIAALLN